MKVLRRCLETKVMILALPLSADYINLSKRTSFSKHIGARISAHLSARLIQTPINMRSCIGLTQLTICFDLSLHK